jgi:protein-S-isoprenylcysteine O-methyltransferase Ste14
VSAAGDTAGIRLHPPLVFAAALAIGLALEHWHAWPLPDVATRGARHGAGLLLFLAGGALAAPAIRSFLRAGTGVPVHHKVTALVTTGIYAWTRNPMYLGLALVMAGSALWANSLWLVIALVAMMLVIARAVIAREEAFLEAKFGDAYRDYKARVRRWL